MSYIHPNFRNCEEVCTCYNFNPIKGITGDEDDDFIEEYEDISGEELDEDDLEDAEELEEELDKEEEE